MFACVAWRALIPRLRAGVAQLVEQLIRNQQVLGSSPSAGSSIQWSIPVTWVTVHSGGIGNTFGPNGLSMGSSLQVSSSKYPSSYCMKLTNQTRSPTCVTPTFCPAKT